MNEEGFEHQVFWRWLSNGKPFRQSSTHDRSRQSVLQGNHVLHRVERR